MKSIPLFCVIGFVAAILIITMVSATESTDTYNESIQGERNLGQYYTWTVHNASGRVSATYHFTVYDYKEIGNHYDYWSENWAQWFVEVPEPGKKYIAVWIRGDLEGTTWMGWGPERFFVWIGNQSTGPEKVKMQDVTIGGRGSDRRLPVIIQELENVTTGRSVRGRLTTERYAWKDENELTRMEPGPSNAYDGYLIFKVPENSTISEIRVAGWFGYWGTAYWNLEAKEVHQESLEWYQQMESTQMALERETGIRLPDKPVDRTAA
jgi:hypothetical protein